jgi:hypothetical protein
MVLVLKAAQITGTEESLQEAGKRPRIRKKSSGTKKSSGKI